MFFTFCTDSISNGTVYLLHKSISGITGLKSVGTFNVNKLLNNTHSDGILLHPTYISATQKVRKLEFLLNRMVKEWYVIEVSFFIMSEIKHIFNV